MGNRTGRKNINIEVQDMQGDASLCRISMKPEIAETRIKYGKTRHKLAKIRMIKILFICHGNICRSVGAQYILQDMVNQKHIAGHFLVDSSATSDEEIGNPGSLTA